MKYHKGISTCLFFLYTVPWFANIALTINNTVFKYCTSFCRCTETWWHFDPVTHLQYISVVVKWSVKGGSRNASTFVEKCPYVSESEFISCTTHTYAPGGGLLIASQKLCFHSDCLSPLWKVFPVVTKTTIQQWQMNVAHSWVMRWAGDPSTNKPSTKLRAGGEMDG